MLPASRHNITTQAVPKVALWAVQEGAVVAARWLKETGRKKKDPAQQERRKEGGRCRDAQAAERAVAPLWFHRQLAIRLGARE